MKEISMPYQYSIPNAKSPFCCPMGRCITFYQCCCTESNANRSQNRTDNTKLSNIVFIELLFFIARIFAFIFLCLGLLRILYCFWAAVLRACFWAACGFRNIRGSQFHFVQMRNSTNILNPAQEESKYKTINLNETVRWLDV